MCVLANGHTQHYGFFVMLGFLTECSLYKAVCIVSAPYDMMNSKRNYTGFYGQIYKTLQVIMNNYVGGPQDYSRFDDLLQRLQGLDILSYSADMIYYSKKIKSKQPREKSQGLKSRGNQGQALGVLST